MELQEIKLEDTKDTEEYLLLCTCNQNQVWYIGTICNSFYNDAKCVYIPELEDFDIKRIKRAFILPKL